MNKANIAAKPPPSNNGFISKEPTFFLIKDWYRGYFNI